jgi:crotonobetainyl-CoA:carnitine CoA-transferase CaiB-like acyl-CoA transferase
MTLLGPAFLDLNVNGRGSRREGYPAGNRAAWPGTSLVNNYRGATVAPHNSYRTAGGGDNDWCVIACFTDQEWDALVAVMGSPAWATEDRFATFAGRLEHQDELDRNIEAWTKTQDKYAVTERCQAAGVRAAPVQSNEDRVEHDPQLRARNAYVPAPHAVLGTFPLQNAPFTFSETPVVTDRAGPLVGEHNIEILSGMLGFSRDEIRAGYEDGTFWPKSVPIEPYLMQRLEESKVP